MIEGLGTTMDVVLVNGLLREGAQVVVCGLGAPIVTTIRSLLTPHPMKVRTWPVALCWRASRLTATCLADGHSALTCVCQVTRLLLRVVCPEYENLRSTFMYTNT